MKQICFVESPLQLLNAYEAEKCFHIESLFYFIRLSGDTSNDKQLLKLLKILHITKYELLTLKVSNKSISDYFKFLYYKYFFKLSADVELVFIGNYTSGFFNLIMKNIDKKKVVLLDDGAKSIDIQSKFSNDLNYNLFTMYDLKPYKHQTIKINKYKRLGESLKQVKKDENQVLFLGLKLSEIGVVSQEYYMQEIKKIASYYEDKQILYISHRGESQDKLTKIKEVKNIKVIGLDYPVELYGLYEDGIPYKVSSFYSTALYTMKNIYDIEAEGFMFDFENFEHKSTICNVYEYYKKYFKVIDLNA